MVVNMLGSLVSCEVGPGSRTKSWRWLFFSRLVDLVRAKTVALFAHFSHFCYEYPDAIAKHSVDSQVF